MFAFFVFGFVGSNLLLLAVADEDEELATGRGRLPLKLQVKSDKRFIGQTATALEEYKQEWKDC